MIDHRGSKQSTRADWFLVTPVVTVRLKSILVNSPSHSPLALAWGSVRIEAWNRFNGFR
jgi:hypothetical protein